VVYGLTGSMRGGRLASGRSGRRNRFGELGSWVKAIAGGWVLPGRRRVVGYSIQWLMRIKRTWFRQDLETLLALLAEGKLRPIIAGRMPLAEARRAHEVLGQGGVVGKIVLIMPDS
jgi:NADPH2:quinone reductase